MTVTPGQAQRAAAWSRNPGRLPVGLDQGQTEVRAKDRHHQSRHPTAGADVDHPCPLRGLRRGEQPPRLPGVPALRLGSGHRGQIDAPVPEIQLVQVATQPRVGLGANLGTGHGSPTPGRRRSALPRRGTVAPVREFLAPVRDVRPRGAGAPRPGAGRPRRSQPCHHLLTERTTSEEPMATPTRAPDAALRVSPSSTTTLTVTRSAGGSSAPTADPAGGRAVPGQRRRPRPASQAQGVLIRAPAGSPPARRSRSRSGRAVPVTAGRHHRTAPRPLDDGAVTSAGSLGDASTYWLRDGPTAIWARQAPDPARSRPGGRANRRHLPGQRACACR